MNKQKINGFFIAGTDTDIGKTYISRKLADSFSHSQKVTYMKPVQTGSFADENGLLIAPDFKYVMEGKAIMNGHWISMYLIDSSLPALPIWQREWQISPSH